jgi:hypothetical protein
MNFAKYRGSAHFRGAVGVKEVTVMGIKTITVTGFCFKAF